MDIKEYISSGILECYVLGSLGREEAMEVEQMALKHPEIKEELNAIQKSINNYAGAFSKMPDPSLKKKIFDSIERQEMKENETKVISVNKKNQLIEYLAAASISFAILSAGAAYYCYNKWQDAEDKFAMMQMQDAVLTQNSHAANYNLEQKLKQSDEQIAMMLDSNTKKIALKGLALAPASGASIFWNKNSKEVYISIKDLPAAPDNKQYQLWALKDGVPVDAGVFDSSDEMQKMKNIDNAQAFAVTLEKKGGSPVPTMNAMYLMGKI